MAEPAVDLTKDLNTNTKPEESSTEKAPPKSSEQDSKSKDEKDSKESKEAEPKKIPGVPYDKEGKRPSDVTVDFNDLPDDIRKDWEERFNKLYRQVKATDRYLDQVGKDFDAKLAKIVDQDTSTSQSVERLTNVVKDLSTEKETAKVQLEINELEKRKAQAYQDMDFDAVSKIDTEIMRKLSQPQKLELPKVEPEKKEDKSKSSDNKADEAPVLTPREEAYMAEWANEMSDDGVNFVRPWAHGWHPMNKFVLDQTAALLNHPSFEKADLETILATVDNIMNPAQQPEPEKKGKKKEPKNPPEVLSADENLRSKKTEGKLTLTNDQMMVAERIFPKLAKEEAHKKYLGGLKKSNGI